MRRPTVVKRDARYCARCGQPADTLDPSGLCLVCTGAPSAAQPGQPTGGRTFATLEQIPRWWEPEPGDRVAATYEVLDRLGSGEGAMGTVHRVRHRGWDVELAMKSPRRDHLVQMGGAEQFVQEASHWVDLGLHPHIVSCYFVRTLGDVPRVFAELVEGGSLKEWVADGRLHAGGRDEALARVLDVAIQTAWGLAYAHAAGLVHLDVKPANVLMAEDGTAKVTDFGLAVRVPGLSPDAAPEEGPIGGTPAYLSPEQADAIAAAAAHARGEQVDPRDRVRLTSKTDVWSWALCVLDMLVGDPAPHRYGPAGAAELAAWTGDVGAGRGPVPEALRTVLARCLAPADDRPADLDRLAEELIATYTRHCGHAYPRARPRPAVFEAASLTNKALSLLELGRADEALATLDAAVSADPHHPEAAFNHAMLSWERGRITDLDAAHQVERVANATGGWLPWCLLAQVHGRRRDADAAIAALGAAAQRGAPESVRDDLRAICQQRDGWPRLLANLETMTDSVTELAYVDGSAVGVARDRSVAQWADGATTTTWTVSGLHAPGLRAASICPGTGLLAAVGGPSGPTPGLPGTAPVVVVYRLADRERVTRIVAPGALSPSVSLSRDGRYLLTGDGDGGVSLWQLAALGADLVVQRAPAEPVQAPEHGVGYQLVLLEEARMAAVSSGPDWRVRVWDLTRDRDPLVLAELQGVVSALSTSADGRWLATASSDLTVRVWDLDSGRCHRILRGHGSPVNAVAMLHSPRWVVSAGMDRTVRLWDVDSGVCVRSFEGHPESIRALAVSEDDTSVLSGDSTGEVRQWLLGDLGALPSFRPALATVERIENLQRSVDLVERALVRAQDRMAVRDWPAAADEVRAARQVDGHARDRALLDVWEVLGRHGTRTGLTGSWPAGVLSDPTEMVMSVAVDQSFRRVMAGCADGTLHVWDVDPPAEVMRATPHGGSNVLALAFSPDGRAAASGGADGSVRCWDPADPSRVPQRWSVHDSDGCYGLCFSPDGQALASVGPDGTVMVLSPRTGEGSRLRRLRTGLFGVTYTADGQLVLCAGADHRVHVLDARTGKETGQLVGHGGVVFSVATAGAGRLALTGSEDRTLRLWDTTQQRCLGVLPGHDHCVLSVALTPDGRFGLSGSWDRTVRVWDLAAQQCIGVLGGHGSQVHAIAASRTARYVASGGWDDTVRLWELDWEFAW